MFQLEILIKFIDIIKKPSIADIWLKLKPFD